MKLSITGSTGLVGRFIVDAALESGHEITLLSRAAPGEWRGEWQEFQLGDPPNLQGQSAVIHAAFDHIPGRYRGGEGDDPERFRQRNLEGSLRLVQAADRVGCRVIFLSSRAVYGDYPLGTKLTEDMAAAPDTLYGEVKREVEKAVTALGGTSLRVTGVYGPPGAGQKLKWADLFDDFAKGREITPRKATEVHGADVAAACLLALNPDAPVVLNVSDLMLDRHDLLSLWSEISGERGHLPERVRRPGPAEMDCGQLRLLGWKPKGIAGLRDALTEITQAGARSTP